MHISLEAKGVPGAHAGKIIANACIQLSKCLCSLKHCVPAWVIAGADASGFPKAAVQRAAGNVLCMPDEESWPAVGDERNTQKPESRDRCELSCYNLIRRMSASSVSSGSLNGSQNT